MTSLIIPDIHNKVESIDSIITTEKPDEVIFLGDYFDAFDDSPREALKVARWLKARLYLPGYLFILGNHETQYRWPKSSWHITGAYSKEKQKAIDSVLTPKDWERTVFAVERDTWWISHAGLHPNIFDHPILGWDNSRIWEILHDAEFKAKAGIHTPVTDQCRAQGETPSGPQWLRWNEFETVPYVNQIVGHTAHRHPVEIHGENSRNVNLDTWMQYYGILKDGELTTKKNMEAPIMTVEIEAELNARYEKTSTIIRDQNN